jgi:DNA-binding NtrC family response regulator
LVDVLLIDDEMQFLKSLAEGLQMHLSRCGIFTAFDGTTALEIMQKNPVDVVVTDLNMPRMDGIEFLWHMQEKYPQVPIIITSAQTRECVEENLKFLKIFDYLEKPLDLDNVASSILAAASAGSAGSGEFHRTNGSSVRG